jgi:RHS repeat-associated protein
MELPGRTFTANKSYRYGYQSSEKNNDCGCGDNYTTFYRELDTRILRWWSVDPVTDYSMSPYNSMDNNPINKNDVKGDCPDCPWWKKTIPELWHETFNNYDNSSVARGVDNFNRNVNPVGIVAHGVYGASTGKDLITGGKVDRVTSGTDMMANLIMLAAGEKFFTMVAAPRYATTATLKEEVALLNSRSSSYIPKSSINQNTVVRVLSKEEVAKVQAYVASIPRQKIATKGVLFGKDIQNNLSSQAQKFGAAYFRNWGEHFNFKIGYSFEDKFKSAIVQTISKGEKVIFDLTSVNIRKSISGVGNFSQAVNKKLATEWELNQILNNPTYKANTIFYKDGKRQSSNALQKLGIN